MLSADPPLWQMRGRCLGRGEASSLACWWSANGIQWELWWVANWFQCEFWALCRMLASCVIFASNVGCSRTFVGPCGPKFFVFGLLVSHKLVSMTGVLPRRSEVSMSGRLRFFESCRLKVFPAVRAGAFRTDFVASQKVRFRWLPTGFLGVQRAR